ncbi:emp24/gp25L/p24 family/GOLD-domain-containing protein [Melampsora americana]|nr:emp24/gp25L/p24 family/GOLD-domain-containing protein [Melampsora americana]
MKEILWMICFLMSLIVYEVKGIKFDLTAEFTPTPRCIWYYAMADTLVVISTNIESGEDQSMDLEIIDGSVHRNVYQAKKGINGETRIAITTHNDADLGVCFTNTLSSTVDYTRLPLKRTIDLDVDIGADAVDYNAIAKAESLSGLEVEMRKLEGIIREIVEELNYLKRREAKMRDTNESTNWRINRFALITITVLFSSGLWQIWYLRRFFKRKNLIE